MLKSMPLSGMIFNVKPNFTELWWHESNFPKDLNNKETAAQQGLAFVVERKETTSHVAGLNRIQCYAVLLVLVLTSILLVV
jgi:hypothetical protein